tara:strand:- start:1056 stop:1640 length:585 start_codon:yes stop_codon:yes gene_type:complete
MAPELFNAKSKYGPSIDVYSFGILMWEILALQMPFREFQTDQIIEKVCDKCERPFVNESLIKNAPVAYVELMFLCWHENSKRRPPIGQVATILKHDVIVCEDSVSNEGKEYEIIDMTHRDSSTASEILLEHRRSIMSQQRRRSSMLSHASCRTRSSNASVMLDDEMFDDPDEEESSNDENDETKTRHSLEIDSR